MQTEEQKRKKRKKILKVLAALMGVFLLIGCCGVGGLMFLDDDEGISTPTVVTTTAATTTPMPTSTPTATPMPTRTPQSTSVPTDEVDAKYISRSTALLERYSKAMTAWGRWALSFEKHATFKGWATEAIPILAEVLIVGEEIRDLQPSSRFEASYNVLCEATEHYDTAVHLTAEGLDTLNSDLVTEAVEELNLGNDLIAEAAELLPD